MSQNLASTTEICDSEKTKCGFVPIVGETVALIAPLSHYTQQRQRADYQKCKKRTVDQILHELAPRLDHFELVVLGNLWYF